MPETRRLGQEWTEPELVVVVEMYLIGGKTDSHEHDDIARCLGRYNAATRTFHDGAVNQKLAEIKGHVEGGRVPRHPGNPLIRLVERYRNDHAALRLAAVAAWRNIVRDYGRPPPQYVAALLERGA